MVDWDEKAFMLPHVDCNHLKESVCAPFSSVCVPQVLLIRHSQDLLEVEDSRRENQEENLSSI